MTVSDWAQKWGLSEAEMDDLIVRRDLRPHLSGEWVVRCQCGGWEALRLARKTAAGWRHRTRGGCG